MNEFTPRSVGRLAHTPKMSERKRALFQAERRSLGRGAPKNITDALDEDSGDSCDLGIISSLDTSSSPERYDQSVSQTPNAWRSEVRRGQRTVKLNRKYINDLIQSPLSFKNYFSRSVTENKSAPVTPRRPAEDSPLFVSGEKFALGTESIGGRSKVCKSLSDLIADTESCSSSLKDLTFDSDSGAETKENTPRRRRSAIKLRHKCDSVSNYGSGHDSEKTNSSPLKTINNDSFLSPRSKTAEKMPTPSKMFVTPTTIDDETMSPPKMHNRKFILEVIEESPMSDGEKINNLKRARVTDDSYSPHAKSMKMDAPKARLSLDDKIKQFLTTKSFYPKSNEAAEALATNVSRAIRVKYPLTSKRIHSFNLHRSYKRPKRIYGEINMGVRHKIRKPKQLKINKKLNPYVPFRLKSSTQTVESAPVNDNILDIEKDKGDVFESEHRTIENLLDQWTEEDVPVNEPQVTFTDEHVKSNIRIAESLVHNTSLSHTVLYSDIPTPTGQTLAQNTVEQSSDPESSADGCNFVQANSIPVAELDSAAYLPVDGGFLIVEDSTADIIVAPKNLEEIESEIKFLDDQIAKMAKINNINTDLLLSPTSRMCDMASGLALTSPKIVNGVPLPETDTGTSNAIPDNQKEDSTGSESTARQLPEIEESPRRTKEDQLFPVFTKSAIRVGLSIPKATKLDCVVTPKGTLKKLKRSNKDQYIIDAGQKKIGVTQCNECGVIYHIGDPQDEMDHLTHHNAVDVLRFQGWKDEFVCGVWGTSRCIRVRGSGSESGLNGVRWKRVIKLLERVVHPQLGYAAQLPSEKAHEFTAYLYIENKQIIGCLVAELKTNGYKYLPGIVDCCSREEYPVKCGISRLWTHISHRRHGIATHLVNSMRANFLYGQILTVEEIAFSAPTPAGKAFAQNYTGMENFLIYLN